jgi:hypothetical protein
MKDFGEKPTREEYIFPIIGEISYNNRVNNPKLKYQIYLGFVHVVEIVTILSSASILESLLK